MKKRKKTKLSQAPEDKLVAPHAACEMSHFLLDVIEPVESSIEVSETIRGELVPKE